MGILRNLAFAFGLVLSASAATEAELKNVTAALTTGSTITVAETDRLEALKFALANPAGNADLEVRLELKLTDYFGKSHEWRSDAVLIAAGKSVELPIAKALPSIGWWQLEPRLVSADGGAAVGLPARKVAWIDPLEVRDHPPEDGFWFGFDTRVRDPETIRLLSAMGVDILRFGTWGGVYSDEGELDWKEFDRVVDLIRGNGMQALYSITFTPKWANRKGAKGNLSRLPPDSAALEKSLREVIPHTRDKGLLVYDLWNEPDHAGFWHGNVEDYLEFLRVSYTTIKEVHPEAKVLSGGIASFLPMRFPNRNPDMAERVILDGREHYDAISLHEHGSYPSFVKALEEPVAGLQKKLGEAQPLWFTETGDDSGDHAKARVLVRKVVTARSHGAESLIWYALYQKGQGGAYNVIDKNADLPRLQPDGAGPSRPPPRGVLR